MNIINSKKATKIFLIQFILLIIGLLFAILVFFLLEPVSPKTENLSKIHQNNQILEGIFDEIKINNISTETSSIATTSNPDVRIELSSGMETTEKINSIEIASISVDGKIVQGDKSNQNNLLLQGFWLYPETGFPDINTRIPSTPVIFGHRLFKKPPETETFYNLDQLKGGEIIRVNFNKIVYYYEVINIRIIDKFDWAAIEPEPFDALKLVTCTPLDSFENAPFRILVTAKLIK